MIDKYFVDTHILVYANDNSDNEKCQMSKKIILDGIRIVENVKIINPFITAPAPA